MYHRICSSDAAAAGGFSPNRELTVRADEFDRQMAHLARHYRCLALPEAVVLLRAGRLPRRSVIVTFDDGYLDNLTLALPILRRHGIPATIYITTGVVDHSARLWWYELEQLIAGRARLDIEWKGKRWTERIDNPRAKAACFKRLDGLLKRLDPDDQARFMRQLGQGEEPRLRYAGQVLDKGQIIALAKDPLITIGAHSHHHSVLSCLSEAQLRHELATSRDQLERWTGQPVRHLAYPFGGRHQAGPREFRLAEALGFESATTTRIGHLYPFHGRQLFALPRIAIGHHDTMTSFRWKLSGLESLTRRPASRILI